LSGFLARDYKPFHRQILFALASLVATEHDPQTQEAVADLVAGLEGDTIAENDWSYFQKALASQSRALMAKGNLFTQRQFHVETIAPSNEELSARHVGHLIAAVVRKGVLSNQKGYKNYRGIYCEDCDFHGAQFPEKADFTGSVLDHANFRGATLQGAFFDNADLEGAVFSEAFLETARFRSLLAERIDGSFSIDEKGINADVVFTPYLFNILRLLQTQATLRIQMPDFSCAYLRDARFDKLALFPFINRPVRSFAIGDEVKGGWRLTVPDIEKVSAAKNGPVEFPVLIVVPPNFYNSDLRGAHLERARFFSIVRNGELADSHGFLSAIGPVGSGPLSFMEGKIDEKVLEVPALGNDPTSNAEIEQDSFKNDLRMSFHQTTVEGAALPPGVADFLQKTKSSRGGFSQLDWDCKPRIAIAK
jgi:uncharacterized protein YjbI with pentapeptide repeats